VTPGDMPAPEASLPETKRTGSIAPWGHTALVAVALAGLSIASHYQHGLPNLHLPGMSSRLSSYLTVMIAEWLLVLVIWLVLKRRGVRLHAGDARACSKSVEMM